MAGNVGLQCAGMRLEKTSRPRISADNFKKSESCS